MPGLEPGSFYLDFEEWNKLISNMKICPNCENEIEKIENKFCSQSCSASFNNKRRSLSDETKMKISKSLRASSSMRPVKHQRESNRDAFIKTMIRKMMEAEFDSLPHQSKRKRIIIEQDGKCAHCGLSEWRGKPICFEMDHIDGDNTNNQRSNLEILCPNCHSNTPTWKGRKNARDNSRIEDYIKARKEMVCAEGIEPSRLP